MHCNEGNSFWFYGMWHCSMISFAITFSFLQWINIKASEVCRITQHACLCYRNFSVLIRELLSGWILLPITDVLADPAIVNSLLLLFLDNYTLSQYPNRPPTRVAFLARFVSSVPISHDSVSISYISSKVGMQLIVKCQ